MFELLHYLNHAIGEQAIEQMRMEREYKELLYGGITLLAITVILIIVWSSKNKAKKDSTEENYDKKAKENTIADEIKHALEEKRKEDANKLIPFVIVLGLIGGTVLLILAAQYHL